MLVHHVVPREAGVPERGDDVPGHDDRRQHEEPEPGAEARDPAPAAIAERDRGDRQAGEHEGHEALGENADAEGGVEAGEPACAACAVALRRLPAEERHPHRRGEDHVGPERPRLEHEAEAGGERQPGDQAGRPAVEERPQAAGGEERHHGRAHRHQARPLGRSRDAEDERREPEHERRLVQEEREVEVRRDPIAPERHLARHLRVARFVVEEGGDVEADGEQCAGPESERQRAPAPERQRPRERDQTLFTDCHSGSLGDRQAKVNALAWVPPAR